MKVVSSESIILKIQDFKEADRLVTFLARDKGRMTGVARGARKLNARGLGNYEPFSHGTIYYTEKHGADLVSIRKCDPLPPHMLLEANYDKFLYAGYMAELVSLCRISQVEAEGFFQLLAGGLAALLGQSTAQSAQGTVQSAHGTAQSSQDTAQSLALLRLEFELNFLELLGLQPDWGRCGNCERPLFETQGAGPRLMLGGKHQFDIGLGGLRCPDCHAGGWMVEELSAGSLAFLAAWRGGSAPEKVKPTRNALAELERAVTRHLVHQLEREPRSLALLPVVEKPAHRPGGGAS